MKVQHLCDICGKVFGEDQKQECLQHEISHLDLNEKLKGNLKEALKRIEDKYKCITTLSYVKVRGYIDYLDVAQVEYKYGINSNRLDKQIQHIGGENYKDGYTIPSVQSLLEGLDKCYFMPQIKLKYEGVFDLTDNDCSGIVEYKIGETTIDTIYRAFKDRKVKIEVIE